MNTKLTAAKVIPVEIYNILERYLLSKPMSEVEQLVLALRQLPEFIPNPPEEESDAKDVE